MNLERVKQFYSWEKQNNEKSGLKKQEKREGERKRDRECVKGERKYRREKDLGRGLYGGLK